MINAGAVVLRDVWSEAVLCSWKGKCDTGRSEVSLIILCAHNVFHNLICLRT